MMAPFNRAWAQLTHGISEPCDLWGRASLGNGVHRVPPTSRAFSIQSSSSSVSDKRGIPFNLLPSESVKCRFSKCRFSVLNLKFDFISDGGRTREKQIQKALGSLPPCRNRCRFSESAICSSRVRPPSEIKSNFKFKTLRWRPLRWRLTLSDSLLQCKGIARHIPSQTLRGVGGGEEEMPK